MNTRHSLRVAIKKGRSVSDEKYILNEIRTLQIINQSSYIVKMLDFFVGPPSEIVLEYIEGGTLHEMIFNPLKYYRVGMALKKRIFLEMVLALYAVHSKGFCHNDVTTF